jgi:hypothetical protein
MSIVCDCDDLTLDVIPQNVCAEDLGQITKIGVQLQQPSGTPPFANLAAIQDLDEWIDLLDANDETKIVITPIVENFVVPPTNAILEGGGGGNDTLDGMPFAHDGEPARAEGMMRSISAAIRRAMKKIQCSQTLDRPVVVYLFNTAKKKVAAMQASDGTGYQGIPAYAFFTGDPGSEGNNQSDKTPIGFSLPYGWADYRKIVNVDFDPRTELVPTAS